MLLLRIGVSELVSLRVVDIDGEHQLLRVEQGKGAKDRQVLIAPTLLAQLRRYWQAQRPEPWLFPSETYPQRHLSHTVVQNTLADSVCQQ